MFDCSWIVGILEGLGDLDAVLKDRLYDTDCLQARLDTITIIMDESQNHGNDLGLHRLFSDLDLSAIAALDVEPEGTDAADNVDSFLTCLRSLQRQSEGLLDLISNLDCMTAEQFDTYQAEELVLQELFAMTAEEYQDYLQDMIEENERCIAAERTCADASSSPTSSTMASKKSHS